VPPKEQDLSPAELEVLKALWAIGPATVRDVLEHLAEQGRKLAYTTVLTFLTRLEQKRYVQSNKKGQAYIYKPKPGVTREKVSKSRVRALLNELYDGAAAPLLLHLVEDRQLSKNDLEQLQGLIDELDRNQARGGKRSKRKRSDS
jgi:BlaI family penicillinase repressor